MTYSVLHVSRTQVGPLAYGMHMSHACIQSFADLNKVSLHYAFGSSYTFQARQISQ